jgi:electron transfer flavoprotein alpha/beta subunit
VKVVVWLGSTAPARSVRWLDGALAAAAKFPDPTALAAGDPSWLDLAADRATRAGLPAAGIATDLELDYLGWAQVVVAAAKHLGAATVIVDEANQPGRFAEVGAIAELTGAIQLTRVVALAPDGDIVHASRAMDRELQTLRVRGPAVIGVRIAGPAIDEFPTPMPSSSMRRLEVAALGLDTLALAHRALPRRSIAPSRKTADRIADYLAVHLVPRRGA